MKKEVWQGCGRGVAGGVAGVWQEVWQGCGRGVADMLNIMSGCLGTRLHNTTTLNSRENYSCFAHDYVYLRELR